VNTAYADDTVRILEGNVAPTCITDSTCYDKTSLSITTGETVTWINEDVPAHTIVSGSLLDGNDGYFDSALILPDKTFSWTFTTEGSYPYYCVLHPWASGVINVSGVTIPEPVEQVLARTEANIEGDQDQVKLLGGIGERTGDGKSFQMSYRSQGQIIKSFVNDRNNYILFTFGVPAPAGDLITMKLHSEMITDPSIVEVNGSPLEENRYAYAVDEQFNLLSFTAPEEIWEIKIHGSQVVPEFGIIAGLILSASVMGTIVISRKFAI
jgi:predicted secreted protein with PEFG-CTERM motif